jgi:hypothetical protein
VTNLWTVEALASASLGASRSEFGSLPSLLTWLFTVRRYF